MSSRSRTQIIKNQQQLSSLKHRSVLFILQVTNQQLKIAADSKANVNNLIYCCSQNCIYLNLTAILIVRLGPNREQNSKPNNQRILSSFGTPKQQPKISISCIVLLCSNGDTIDTHLTTILERQFLCINLYKLFKRKVFHFHNS